MAEDLAAANIQALEDILATGSTPADLNLSIKRSLQAAKDAQAAGDAKKSVEISTSALTALKNNSVR